VQSATGYMMFR